MPKKNVTMQQMAATAVRMNRFIDSNLDEGDTSFDIEGAWSSGNFVIMLVANGLEDKDGKEVAIVIDEPGKVTHERANEIVSEWVACLRWLKAITGCILTIDELNNLDSRTLNP